MKTKSLISYTAIYAAIIGATLFFPYIQYNQYEYKMEMFFQVTKTQTAFNEILYGRDFYPIYGLFGGVLLTLPLIMVRQTLLMANIGRVIGVLLSVYVCLVYMALSSEPSFYKGYEDVRFQNALYIAMVSTFGYTIILALNAGVVKRFPDDSKAPHSDLLDDQFD